MIRSFLTTISSLLLAFMIAWGIKSAGFEGQAITKYFLYIGGCCWLSAGIVSLITWMSDCEEAGIWTIFGVSILAQGLFTVSLAAMILFEIRPVIFMALDVVGLVISVGVSWLLMPKLFPPAPTLEDRFHVFFDFYPAQLSIAAYRKDAFVKLAFAAAEAAKCFKEAAVHSGVFFYRFNFNKAVSHFNAARNLLARFDTDLAEAMPHWKDMPEYIRRWERGESVDIPQPRAKANAYIGSIP